MQPTTNPNDKALSSVSYACLLNSVLGSKLKPWEELETWTGDNGGALVRDEVGLSRDGGIVLTSEVLRVPHEQFCNVEKPSLKQS
jgi:hypothetical protein